jgi:hypothetical protein
LCAVPTEVEDDHGFSLTSPQPKAFAHNLEKIYSSLEQVDSSVLFPEQQRLAMEYVICVVLRCLEEGKS